MPKFKVDSFSSSISTRFVTHGAAIPLLILAAACGPAYEGDFDNDASSSTRSLKATSLEKVDKGTSHNGLNASFSIPYEEVTEEIFEHDTAREVLEN